MDKDLLTIKLTSYALGETTAEERNAVEETLQDNPDAAETVQHLVSLAKMLREQLQPSPEHTQPITPDEYRLRYHPNAKDKPAAAQAQQAPTPAAPAAPTPAAPAPAPIAQAKSNNAPVWYCVGSVALFAAAMALVLTFTTSDDNTQTSDDSSVTPTAEPEIATLTESWNIARIAQPNASTASTMHAVEDTRASNGYLVVPAPASATATGTSTSNDALEKLTPVLNAWQAIAEAGESASIAIADNTITAHGTANDIAYIDAVVAAFTPQQAVLDIQLNVSQNNPKAMTPLFSNNASVSLPMDLPQGDGGLSQLLDSTQAMPELRFSELLRTAFPSPAGNTDLVIDTCVCPWNTEHVLARVDLTTADRELYNASTTLLFNPATVQSHRIIGWQQPASNPVTTTLDVVGKSESRIWFIEIVPQPLDKALVQNLNKYRNLQAQLETESNIDLQFELSALTLELEAQLESINNNQATTANAYNTETLNLTLDNIDQLFIANFVHDQGSLSVASPAPSTLAEASPALQVATAISAICAISQGTDLAGNTTYQHALGWLKAIELSEEKNITRNAVVDSIEARISPENSDNNENESSATTPEDASQE